MYIVTGGIFADTAFQKVESDYEYYGPYETYDEAKEAWTHGMFNQKLDICTHRLLIKEV